MSFEYVLFGEKILISSSTFIRGKMRGKKQDSAFRNPQGKEIPLHVFNKIIHPLMKLAFTSLNLISSNKVKQQCL